tara:strand:+ start:2450 stop:2893 length:444 start_codon:yes stop_codon:yes gene_type:complete
MANLTTALNGSSIKIMDASSAILVAYAQSGTLNVNMSTRSITNKESSGWDENMEGVRNWDVSVDGAYAWVNVSDADLSNSADDVLNSYIITRAQVTVQFGTDSTATGDTYYEGKGWLTAWSVSAPTEDTATYSISITGSGALAQNVS